MGLINLDLSKIITIKKLSGGKNPKQTPVLMPGIASPSSTNHPAPAVMDAGLQASC